MTEKENLQELLNQDKLQHNNAEAPARDMETRELLADEEEASAALDTDNLEDLIKAAAAFGWAKKARDIVGIDLRDVSPVADYFLIMSGRL